MTKKNNADQNNNLKQDVDGTKAPEAKVTYSMSPGFAEFLLSLNTSVALTSYQSSKLYLLGKNPKGGLMVNEQVFPRAMGLRYHQ